MKRLILLIIFLSTLFSYSQEFIKCKDSINYLYIKNNNYHSYLKVEGKLEKTENPKVFKLGDYILQTLLIEKNKFNKGKDNEIEIIVNYILKESEYLTSVYKSKLDLNFVPIELEKNKKAVLWFFKIPEEFKKNINEPIKAERQVFVSRLTEEFIYSIASTQFENQSFEKIKEILGELIKSVEYGKVKEEICN
ncbi:hypothetical protein LPB136_08530 [Tenacibaculum todarodis]|uniref:Uncharacterized protein n=1 Tax=Tenacibaculum todarodis TaxID=1850252 RepID=A0A1L3JJR4_9FLAO|nr:hypothetical protein [Tenacibaculum todarodis]APG65395.1 hypothetical protein LPB136_08530 [Tenacibaculum todarodis]